jgi:hypothetical protein
VCNGAVLVWCSRNSWHVFDLSTGIRIKKEKYNSSPYPSCYCTKENQWFNFDCASYATLFAWKCEGYKARVIGKKEEVKVGDLPIILDSVKGEILSSIEAE